ncbi:M23 family metallopeptidase [Cryobacterium psychrophilum]|nr:M23 family metallopeptidase [Cryobacterium psychrophilum]TDW29536.1 peptidase M23-like protein [Cryobacterium psychrophilum]
MRSALGRGLVGLTAMSAVGLMMVTTAMPALAMDSVTAVTSTSSFTASGASSSHSPAEQSIDISADAVAAPAQRDGYTFTEVPKVVVPAVEETTPFTLGLGWVLPVAGHISSPYGPRANKPVDGVGSFHNGTDIAASCGQPVSAANGGTVVEAGYKGSYGNWVLIDHGDGIQTGYAHNSTVLVTKGQTVSAGETIAEVGSTGASSGCHVHFETRVDDSPVNPRAFMSARGVSLG